jgi:hypothetical protein
MRVSSIKRSSCVKHQAGQYSCQISCQISSCEKFLYGFKAARRAARAADSARSPPLRWRSRCGGARRRSAGAKSGKPRAARHTAVTRVQRRVRLLPLRNCPGRARTRQERLRRRLRRSSTLDRTCPKVPESAAIGSRGNSGQDGSDRLTLKRQLAGRPAAPRQWPPHHPALPGRRPCLPSSVSRQVVPVSPCSLRGLLLPHVSREFDREGSAVHRP